MKSNGVSGRTIPPRCAGRPAGAGRRPAAGERDLEVEAVDLAAVGLGPARDRGLGDLADLEVLGLVPRHLRAHDQRPVDRDQDDDRIALLGELARVDRPLVDRALARADDRDRLAAVRRDAGHGVARVEDRVGLDRRRERAASGGLEAVEWGLDHGGVGGDGEEPLLHAHADEGGQAHADRQHQRVAGVAPERRPTLSSA